MNEFQHGMFMCSGANHHDVRIGWAPAYFEFFNATQRTGGFWDLGFASPDGIEYDANGVRGAITASITEGLTLLKMEGTALEIAAGEVGASTLLEQAEWYKANGMRLNSGLSGLTDGDIYTWKAFRCHNPVIRLIHDGGASQTFIQDSSVDLREAGVTGNGKWIVYNTTANDDYAFLGAITKPSGQTKYCRALTFTTAELSTATAAAALADADELFLIKAIHAAYPLSDIGNMT